MCDVTLPVGPRSISPPVLRREQDASCGTPNRQPGAVPLGRSRTGRSILTHRILEGFRHALSVHDPADVTERAVRRWRTEIECKADRESSSSTTLVVAMGKAALGMLEGVRRAFATVDSSAGQRGPGVDAAILVHANDHETTERACRFAGSWREALPHSRLSTISAEHPVPGSGSREAADRVLAALRPLREGDRALFLISGGSSAMFERTVVPEASEAAVAETYRTLIHSGLDITAMNAIRKVLSAVKGGRTAAAAYPASVTTFVISDVPPGDASAIGSGPTVPDPEAWLGARRSADSILPDLPVRFREYLSREITWRSPPLVVRSDPVEVLVDNRSVLESLAAFLDVHGYTTTILEEGPELGARDAAELLIGSLHRSRRAGRIAILCGGEISVPMPNREGGATGLGGRNQAFVLECVPKIAGTDVEVWSLATDGIDGNSPFAGARADGTSAERARALGLDSTLFARRFDSASFFHALGDTIHIGPTGHNVRDVRILLGEATEWTEPHSLRRPPTETDAD